MFAELVSSGSVSDGSSEQVQWWTFFLTKMEVNYRNDSLVLVAHGSTINDQSSAAVRQQAEELRRRHIFAEVHVGLWKEGAPLAEVLQQSCGQRVFVVPFFVSHGFFTQEIIPKALGLKDGDEVIRRQVRGDQTIYYSSPVGIYPQMTEVLLARAQGVVARHPFPRAPKLSNIALFIAGHGTELNENSCLSIERQVELIRSRGIYQEVHGIFIEEEPKIEKCFTMSQASNFVIVPFFMSDGLHVAEDIPVMLGEPKRLVQSRLQSGQPTWRNPSEKKGRLVWYSDSVGREPVLAEVILQAVRDCCV